MPLEIRSLPAETHLAFVGRALGQLPADAGLGAGEGRVGQRAARLVRRRRAGRCRAGPAAADPAGQALPGVPARGTGARLAGVRARRTCSPRCSRTCAARVRSASRSGRSWSPGAGTAETVKAALADGTSTARRLGDLPPDETDDAALSLGDRLAGLGWRRQESDGDGFGDFQPRYVFQLPLAGRTEEDLLAGFNQLWRRNIRKAAKDGVAGQPGDRRRPGRLPPALPRDRAAGRLHPAAARVLPADVPRDDGRGPGPAAALPRPPRRTGCSPRRRGSGSAGTSGTPTARPAARDASTGAATRCSGG